MMDAFVGFLVVMVVIVLIAMWAVLWPVTPLMWVTNVVTTLMGAALIWVMVEDV